MLDAGGALGALLHEARGDLVGDPPATQLLHDRAIATLA
jgi:hypothetical protein